jgi:fumarate hydratase class II
MPDIRKETHGLGVVEVPCRQALGAQIQRSVELTARRTVEK